MGVEVVQFPADVLTKFAEASTRILTKETSKGDRARKGGDALTKLMKDLGYI